MAVIEGVELAKHNSRKSCWIEIDGVVWDVTDFIDRHPGGANMILRVAGRDATDLYSTYHPRELVLDTLGEGAQVGAAAVSSVLKPALNSASATPPSSPSGSSPADRSAETPSSPAATSAVAARPPPLRSILSLDDFEAIASRFLSPTTWAYYSSGADDELSVAGNRAAYRKIALRPRILRNVGVVSTATTILGCPSSLPVYMSPSGLAKLAHPQGECAIAAALGKEGMVQVVNTYSSMSIEEIMAARTSSEQTVFWQLYANPDLEKSRDLVQRVERLGVKAIWLTVDSPVVGKRERDDRAQAEMFVGDDAGELEEATDSGGIAAAINKNNVSPCIDWSIVGWLRDVTKLPLVIKGIQSVEDAVLAYEHGVDGIVLSNHGGRSQDTAQAPLLTLLEINRYAPHLLRSRMEIFVDGGIRRGTDVLKALALGARAVGLGRPFLYSLSAGYGERGVRRLVQIIRNEIQSNMALVGATNVKELTGAMLNTRRLERDMAGSAKL